MDMAKKRNGQHTSSISVSPVVADKLARRPASLDGERVPLIRAFFDKPDLLIVDSFAGGGGASSGVAAAMRALGLDREPDIAINHDPDAIAMHKANHPNTKHYIEDVWKVDPREATAGKRVGLAWFSPTCTHFSKAKGTALDESSIKIRGLCWVAIRWAAAVDIDVICMENVEEFTKFGPLHRTHSHGCSREWARKKVANKSGKLVTRGCRASCHYCKPIKGKEGTLYRAFISRLERLGYKVEWRILKACDYGAPTSRKRWFLVARKDGKPIVWPEPTHGPGRANPYRTAAECIDWTIPCRSIFDRDRDLADKTLARISRGIDKFVLNAARPFIVPVAYGDKGGTDVRLGDIDEPMRTICGNRGGHAVVSPMVMKAKTYGGGGNDARSVDEPLGTITCSKRGEHAIAVPYLVHRSNGERPEVIKPDGTVVAGQEPRVYDIKQPHPTVVAGGIKTGLSLAYLVKNNGGNNDRAGSPMGQTVERPIDTIACKDQKSLAVAHLTKLRGTSDAHVTASASSLEEPMPTVSAGGTHMAKVSAYLVRYNGTGDAESVSMPMPTQTTKARFGLVNVTLAKDVCQRARRVAKFLGYDHPIILVLNDEQWVLVDIGMRMLVPRELYNAQSFAPDYQIDHDSDGKPFTKTAQIKMCGNAVPPKMAQVLATAQLEAS